MEDRLHATSTKDTAGLERDPGDSVHVRAACDALRKQIQSVVHIDSELLEMLMVGVMARGHVLLEGIPGIGKTLLARTLARSVDCSFSRVQFTNDLMPSDIVGSMIWRPQQERFDFVRGPLFSNIVLADEINRTSPRTLSCLLEAMENGRVTVESERLVLAEPFCVLATRNPIEFHGTYPVPEAALDRFLMRLELDYPDAEDEVGLYMGREPEARLDELRPLLSIDQLRAMQTFCRKVKVEASVARYVLRFVEATRAHEGVVLGASPRAGLAWLQAARARAALQGRDYVVPDDLKELAIPVLAHRIFLHGSASSEQLVSDLIDTTAVEL